jgi:hypothetical protein
MLTTWHPYPQKLAITSPTSGGRSVGIVRSRTWLERASRTLRDRVALVLNWLSSAMRVCAGTGSAVPALGGLPSAAVPQSTWIEGRLGPTAGNRTRVARPSPCRPFWTYEKGSQINLVQRAGSIH